MTIETAQYIKDFNLSYPEGSSNAAQLDDAIVLVKTVLKTTFPNLDGAVTATPSQLNTPVPVGLIAMWSGSSGSIPTGWHLCDGNSGTPDLRDRFIVGAGTTYAVGATGGSVSATTSSDGAHVHTTSSGGAHDHGGSTASHALTVAQMPSHSHGMTFYADISNSGTNPQGTSSLTSVSTPSTSTEGGNQGHSHSLTEEAAHTHGDTGSSGAHTHTIDTRSPYYALCFIIKT